MAVVKRQETKRAKQRAKVQKVVERGEQRRRKQGRKRNTMSQGSISISSLLGDNAVEADAGKMDMDMDVDINTEEAQPKLRTSTRTRRAPTNSMMVSSLLLRKPYNRGKKEHKDPQDEPLDEPQAETMEQGGIAADTAGDVDVTDHVEETQPAVSNEHVVPEHGITDPKTIEKCNTVVDTAATTMMAATSVMADGVIPETQSTTEYFNTVEPVVLASQAEHVELQSTDPQLKVTTQSAELAQSSVPTAPTVPLLQPTEPAKTPAKPPKPRAKSTKPKEPKEQKAPKPKAPKAPKEPKSTTRTTKTGNEAPQTPIQAMKPNIMNLMNAESTTMDHSPTPAFPLQMNTSPAPQLHMFNTGAPAATISTTDATAPVTACSTATLLATATTPSSAAKDGKDKPDKPKVPRKRKPADPANPPKKKAVKKKDTPSKEGASREASIAVLEPPPLSFNEIQNNALIKPTPNGGSTLPPPQVVEVVKEVSNEPTPTPAPTPSIKDTGITPVTTAKIEEPVIALHIPLYSKEESIGSTQVVFNVMKLCEDKYGWKNIHPNAAKFNMDLYNDEEMDEEDDDDMEDDNDDNTTKEQRELKEKEKEPPKEPIKVDGRKLQKGKPKIGQYDYEDPFIDDSEMLWEEQRASTKDGFFVYYGPLVEEGKNARIERADGSVKRSRKRAVGSATGGAAKKKVTTTKPVAIAPVPLTSAPLIAGTTPVTSTSTGNNTPAPMSLSTAAPKNVGPVVPVISSAAEAPNESITTILPTVPTVTTTETTPLVILPTATTTTTNPTA